MSEHTPGPWRVNWPSGASAVVADTPASAFQSGGEDSVRYYNGHLIAESISPENLPLIAAAPDLLAALRELHLKAVVGTDAERHAALDMAWRAITKATGQ
jgi:hypothetical protein